MVQTRMQTPRQVASFINIKLKSKVQTPPHPKKKYKKKKTKHNKGYKTKQTT